MTRSEARAPYGDSAGVTELMALIPEVVDTVRRWLATSATLPVDGSAARLAGVLDDPRGLRFTVGFVDGVIRPEDPRVAARAFAELARDVPSSLPWHLRTAIRLGARAGLAVPAL
jgi:RHH-type transcriptional regulator, proline utilization regulon repressor / proline dehydrogenase / delta 1-pyrroline-5-carboxylate dehydrogenase